MYKYGERVFISYRGRYIESVRTLGKYLVETELCGVASFFPPDSLTAPFEVLLPYEFIELMEFVVDRMYDANAFIYLNTPDYTNSYFTQAEILQWRRFRDDPIVYAATPTKDSPFEFELTQQRLESMPTSTKSMWASLSVDINRRMRGPMKPAAAWGKFAKNCFLAACASCSEPVLITQKAMYSHLRGDFELSCPHCSSQMRYYEEQNTKGIYYRKPIIAAYGPSMIHEFCRPTKS